MTDLTNDMCSRVYTLAADIVDRGWTQGVMACNKLNEQVPIESTSATCFCLSGAVFKAASVLYPLIGLDKYILSGKVGDKIRSKHNSFYNNAHWNDEPDRTKEEVIALLHEMADEMKEEVA